MIAYRRTAGGDCRPAAPDQGKRTVTSNERKPEDTIEKAEEEDRLQVEFSRLEERTHDVL
jgi:hypothetical protein